jgi:hypothetical protein
MSESEEEITTEPPDPLAGSDDSVAKTGERLQEQADEQEDDGIDPAPQPDAG